MNIPVSGLLGILIAIIIIVAVAYLILWCVQKFLPEVYQPARIIVGVIALIAILYKLAAFFGV